MLNRFEAAFLAYSEIFKFDFANYLHSLFVFFCKELRP
jgi:hypothetical protein